VTLKDNVDPAAKFHSEIRGELCCFASGDDLPRRLAQSAATACGKAATGLRLDISSTPPRSPHDARRRLGSQTEAPVLGAAAGCGCVPRQGYQRALN